MEEICRVTYLEEKIFLEQWRRRIRENGFSKKKKKSPKLNNIPMYISGNTLCPDGLMSSMNNKYPTEMKTGITKEKQITSKASLRTFSNTRNNR